MTVKHDVHMYMRVIRGGVKVVRGPDGRKKLEKSGGQPIFKCMIPDCTHYVELALAVGRKSRCWRCGEELVLNTENTTLKKPTHTWCRKTRAKKDDAA